MPKQRVIWIWCAIFLVYTKSMLAMHIFDNPHFFRANHFFGEPRFEKKGLTSFDVVASRGVTSTSRNAHGARVPLLSLCAPCSATTAKAHLFDLIFLATQNLRHGFFLQFHVPFRVVDIETPDQHCLPCSVLSIKRIAEVSAYVGWACNYQDTQKIDFVDATLKLGIVAPTGRTYYLPAFPQGISVGYGGNAAASMSADLSIGAYEWLTVGGHVRGLLFIPQHQVRLGSIVEAGTYCKADHLIRGLSLLVGYSYASQRPDVGTGHVHQNCCNVWRMQTLHYIVEYDFAKEGRVFCPRLTLYYDELVSGHRVFDASMAGLGVGLEIAW